MTPDDAYASPVDGRYAVARYDGNIEDGESRGFLYSEHNDDNNNSNSTRNNRASTSELKTDALAEEFRIDAKNVRLLERIAVGGFAEVFRGSYQGTLVAVKQLLERGKSVREKLENEVQTLARLRHPNLLLFMGYSLEPPLILTEFMRRGSLHGILKSEECFKVDGLRCLNIAMAVARGMHYLHSRSPPILHLDLKSPNILVDEKWRVKIADFGMSRVRFSTLASARSEFHGTPEWMAPEMLRAEPYDERADIYSFGVVCWELLTARTPWDDLHPMQVVAVVGYSERRLVLPPDWNKRREELVLASSQRHLPLTQADELAFDAIASLFDACSAKDVDARPKSLEHLARVGRASEDVETLVASVVILETSSSYPREHHPILMMMMVCSFRFIRRAALLALLGKKVVERQSSRSSICKKRTFRINNTLNIWTKKRTFLVQFRPRSSKPTPLLFFALSCLLFRLWRSFSSLLEIASKRERERGRERSRVIVSLAHTSSTQKKSKGFTTKEKH